MMKYLISIFTFTFLSIASAQVSGPMFPGPGMPSGGGGCTITYIGASTGQEGTGPSQTLNYNVPSDTTFLVVIGAFAESVPTDIAGITWDGSPMTQAVYATSFPNPNIGQNTGLAIYYLANPVTGTHNAIMSISPIDADVTYMQALALKCVAASSPVDTTGNYTFAYDGVTTSTDTVNVATTTTTPDTIRIGARIVISGGSNVYTPGSGVTETGDFQDATLVSSIFTGYNITSSSGLFNFQTTTDAGIGVATSNDIQVVAAFKKGP